MVSTSELLEILHDSDLAFRTFIGEFTESSQPAPSMRIAIDRHSGFTHTRWADGAMNPEAVQFRRRIWFEAPDHMRVELLRDQSVARLGVRRANHWWFWDRASGQTTGCVEGKAAKPLPPLLRPALLAPVGLISNFRLEVGGTGQRIGREVICARAVDRTKFVGRRAVVWQLEFDREFGVPLHRTRYEDGHPSYVATATNVSFDAAINAASFRFEHSTFSE